MAKPSEILATLREAGLPPQDSANVYALRRQLDTTKGITSDLREKAFLDSFGDDLPTYLEEASVKAKLPTVSAIFETIGVTDDNKKMKGGRKAVEKFVQDFAKNYKDWKKSITDKWGEEGWKYVYEQMRPKVAYDLMNKNIENERMETLLGNREGDGLKGALANVGGRAMQFFRPRAFEAYARGEDPTWKDQLGDAAESALMAVPAAGWSGILSKGALRVAPKVTKAMSGGRVSKILGNIVGNSAAPLAGEAMDAAMYGDEDSNIDRRDFAPSDVIFGALTNLGVNYGLYPKLARAGQVASQSLSRGAGSAAARETLSDIGLDRAARGLGPAVPQVIANKLPIVSIALDEILDRLGQAAPTLFVNRIGKNSDAERALNSFTAASSVLSLFDDDNFLKEYRDEEKNEPRLRQLQKEIGGVMKSIGNLDEALSERDKKEAQRDSMYLEAIAKDPSIIRDGYAPNDYDFKLWLLEKGHKYLKGTLADVPLWEVE